MARFKGNPILRPVAENSWESKYVFNPAMFELNSRIHYFYRAMGDDMVSRLGYASSRDGCTIDERLNHPVFEPLDSCEIRGVEDPRVTVIGDRCIMTYTAYGPIPQIGITSISTVDLLEKRWTWSARTYPFPNVTDKNAAIFPRKITDEYFLFHRVDPNICVAYSNDLVKFRDVGPIMGPREDKWDSLKVGVAGQPLELKDSWLQIYHGVDHKRVYRLGALLLDIDDPSKILFRSEKPFLEPIEEYECKGQVPYVVFSCGSVLKGNDVLLSYGASDSVICISKFKVNELLS